MARWLVLVAMAGCYREPRPSCGFVCGEGGGCPGGYTCNAADNRCHLDGTSVECDSGFDASFEVPDTTPPTVLMRTPMPGATDVPLDASIVVVFSEPVVQYESQVGFDLIGVDGAIFCSATAISTANGFEVDYTPQGPFTGRAVLTATLNAGIFDIAGNPFAGTSWTFTTERDDVAPVIVGTIPADGNVSVDPSAQIIVSFDEPIQFQADSITVDQGVTGSLSASAPYQLTFRPSPALATGTTYTVTVATDVTDLSGNPLAAPLTFSFTTAAM